MKFMVFFCLSVSSNFLLSILVWTDWKESYFMSMGLLFLVAEMQTILKKKTPLNGNVNTALPGKHAFWLCLPLIWLRINSFECIPAPVITN